MKRMENVGDKAMRLVLDNMSEQEKVEPELKKADKREVRQNTITFEDELSDEEFHDKFLKAAVQDSKSPQPMAENIGSNKIPDLNDHRRGSVTDNDIKTEL